MKTDDLITALTADLDTKPKPLGSALAQALFVSVPVAFAALIYFLKVRPDFWQAIAEPGFLFKSVFLVGLSASGLWLAFRVSRPGAATAGAVRAVGAMFALLAVAIVAELIVMPRETWIPRLVGNMGLTCLLSIPLLSIVPLITILTAMRAGAPANPMRAGATAGLLASAIGATFYAPSCPNDSPLYLATWYLFGIAAVTLAGGLIGSKVLRW